MINKTNTLAGTPEYMAPEAIWIVLGSDLELFGYLKSWRSGSSLELSDPSFLTTFFSFNMSVFQVFVLGCRMNAKIYRQSHVGCNNCDDDDDDDDDSASIS